MAFVKVSERTNDHVAVYSCLSADTRDTDGVFAGDICLVNNGDVEQYTGTQWIQTASGGAASVATSSDSVTAYGNYPTTDRLDIVLTTNVSTSDNTVLYTSNDVSMYNYHVIECTAGTVDVFVSVDGTNFLSVAASVELINDVTTGGGIKSIDIATADGAGILRGKFRKIRVLQKGTTASNIRGFHGVE